MNFRSVFHVLTALLFILGLAMGLCGGASALLGDPPEARDGLLASSAAALLAGLILRFAVREAPEPTRRDGFGIVTFGWVSLTVLGALPYMLSGVVQQPVDALFETMSGFTTTGASVMADVESVPRGILLWRALTNWLGGMGVLVLCVAILPFVGGGGMQVYQAEMPGPSKDRLTPRIAATAKLLWGIYVLLTVAQAGLLRLGGMSWYDAFCHAFTTLSTGGFSTRNASIGAYGSVYIETVVIVFMFLGGVNFALHFRALRGDVGRYFRDAEFRYFLGLWLAVCLLLAVNIRLAGAAPTLSSALRQSFFSVTSILTTTGYATADFDLWPGFSCLILVLLMFIGGCASSTAGGVKIIRLFVVFKNAFREIRAFLQPQAVLLTKVGRETLDPEHATGIVSFVMVFVLAYALGVLLLLPFVPDLRTALSAVAAALGNVGPGLGAVGPMTTYADIPAAGKGILTFWMLLGRLELYTVLVLFLPSFWKR